MVKELCLDLSVEELVGWAAFFQLKNEEEDKIMNQNKTPKQAIRHR